MRSGSISAGVAGLLAVAALAGVALAAGSGNETAQAPAPATVRLDLRVRYQTMAGFGGSARVWSDPHVSSSARTVVPPEATLEVLKAAFRRLGLTRLRPLLERGLERVNDNADPRVLDRTKLDFSGRRLDEHIALVQQAKPFGLVTFFPSPVTLEPWLTERNPDEYVELALAIILRWRELGVELRYFAPINEPGTSRGGNRSAEWLRRVVVGLGERMSAEGLRTRLVIPDDLNPTEAYRRASFVLADPRARPYVGALAYHLYGGDSDDVVAMRDLARRYGLPVWMTEYTDPSYRAWPGALRWAVQMHDVIVRGNVSAVDYLWAFSGDVPGAMVAMRFEDGLYRSHRLTPVYFLMGQYSRFVRPGYRRVAAQPWVGPVLTSAFIGPKRRLVVVAANTDDAPRAVAFSIKGGRIVGRVAAVRTSRREQWRQLAKIRPRRPGFRAILAPESVTTFIARTAR